MKCPIWFYYAVIVFPAALSTVSLLMNIGLSIGLSRTQRAQLNVQIHVLQGINTSFPISMDNVTIDPGPLDQLIQCAQNTFIRVPNATVITFNQSVVIPNVPTNWSSTGVVQVLAHGNVTVNGNVSTIPYNPSVIYLGNGSIYYASVPIDTHVFVTTVNGTQFQMALDQWNPPLFSTVPSPETALIPMYDREQDRVQVAPQQRPLYERTFNGTQILLSGGNITLMANNRIGIIQDLQLF